MNVMLDEGGILTALHAFPDACQEVWWGKRLVAVGVTLARVEPDQLRELLTDVRVGAEGAEAVAEPVTDAGSPSTSSSQRRPSRRSVGFVSACW